MLMKCPTVGEASLPRSYKVLVGGSIHRRVMAHADGGAGGEAVVVAGHPHNMQVRTTYLLDAL
jgi:hypothetical protein